MEPKNLCQPDSVILSGTKAASAQYNEEFASSSEDETSTDELPSKHRRMDCESEEKSFTNDSENQSREDVLFPGSTISQTDHIRSVLAFVTRHKCSQRMKTHLLKLIRLHCPPDTRCARNYDSLMEQGKKELEVADRRGIHDVCSLCNALFPEDEEVVQCSGVLESCSRWGFTTPRNRQQAVSFSPLQVIPIKTVYC